MALLFRMSRSFGVGPCELQYIQTQWVTRQCVSLSFFKGIQQDQFHQKLPSEEPGG